MLPSSAATSCFKTSGVRHEGESGHFLGEPESCAGDTEKLGSAVERDNTLLYYDTLIKVLWHEIKLQNKKRKWDRKERAEKNYQ